VTDAEMAKKYREALEEIVACVPHFYQETDSPSGIRLLYPELRKWSGPLHVVFKVARQALALTEKETSNDT
jgi:hypothetical protein